MNGILPRNGIVLALLLGFTLMGCAADQSMIGGQSTAMGQQGTPYPPPGYSHTIQSSHVALYWNCSQPEVGVMEVQGLAFNPWSQQPVRFLELELVGVGPNERTLAAVSDKAPAIQLFTNQSTPFALHLNATGGEARFDLYYRYYFQDRGHSPLVSHAAWGGPTMLAQAQYVQFRVLDACSPTQHLVH